MKLAQNVEMAGIEPKRRRFGAVQKSRGGLNKPLKLRAGTAKIEIFKHRHIHQPLLPFITFWATGGQPLRG